MSNIEMMMINDIVEAIEIVTILGVIGFFGKMIIETEKIWKSIKK